MPSQPQLQPVSPPEDEPPETFGPLMVERLRKDDGRALILYARRSKAARDGGAPVGEAGGE